MLHYNHYDNCTDGTRAGWWGGVGVGGTWATNGVTIAPRRANAEQDPRPIHRMDVGYTSAVYR